MNYLCLNSSNVFKFIFEYWKLHQENTQLLCNMHIVEKISSQCIFSLLPLIIFNDTTLTPEKGLQLSDDIPSAFLQNLRISIHISITSQMSPLKRPKCRRHIIFHFISAEMCWTTRLSVCRSGLSVPRHLHVIGVPWLPLVPVVMQINCKGPHKSFNKKTTVLAWDSTNSLRNHKLRTVRMCVFCVGCVKCALGCQGCGVCVWGGVVFGVTWKAGISKCSIEYVLMSHTLINPTD